MIKMAGTFFKLQTSYPSTASYAPKWPVTEYKRHNGSITSNISYANGFPTAYTTDNVQNYQLAWNYQKSTLTSRYDARKGKTETFSYDGLQRLTGASVSGGVSISAVYHSSGNITSKTDAGTYTYHSGKIHAVTGVTNPNPSPIPLLTQDITYTAFMQPHVVTENNFQLTYTYGADHNRVKSELKQSGNTINTRYYFEAGYEKDITGGTTRYIQYISAPVGLVAIIEGISGSGIHNIHYTYTDHLGSILTVTNGSKNIEAEQSFDAWGRRRDVNSWALLSPTAATSLPVWLYRGYTGHEHLDQFGLINMNGRMYDPVLGRMLSPDNYIADGGFTQDYNRYTYARNNPLIYTDPNGEFVFVPILIGMAYGAIIGAGVSAAVYSASVAVSGQKWNWGAFGRSAAFGAVGGAIGGGLGALGGLLGSFGQSLGYSILSNVASNSATTLAFGGDVTVGGLMGMTVGGIIGAGIGNFNGTSGGVFENIGAELAFGATKGGITGGIGGLIGAAIDGENPVKGFLNGAKYGVISGGTLAGLNILTMGASYIPDEEYGDFGRDKPVYRRGNFLWPKSAGIALGRNLVTRFTGEKRYDRYLAAHETGHFQQQREMGFANFYARTIGEYFKYGQIKTYDTIGTLEFGAQLHALNRIGYFFSPNFNTYINHSNYGTFYPNTSK